MAEVLTYASITEVETALAHVLDVLHRVPVASVIEAEKLHGHAVRLRDEVHAVRRVDESCAGGTDRFRQVHNLEPLGGSRRV